MPSNKLFRCEAGGCDTGTFEAAKAVCPGCGASAAEGDAVLELIAVHYLAVDKAGAIRTRIGRRTVACNPASKQLPPAASGERLAVTCPACRATPLFAAHDADNVDNNDPLIDQKIAAQVKKK